MATLVFIQEKHQYFLDDSLIPSVSEILKPIHDKIYGGIYLQKESKIAREYAILIDYIVDLCRNKKHKINSIEDIRFLLYKYPPSKTPITCI